MATLHFKNKTVGQAVCEAYNINPNLVCRDIKFNLEPNEIVTIDVSLVVTGEKLKEIGKLLCEIVTN